MKPIAIFVLLLALGVGAYFLFVHDGPRVDSTGTGDSGAPVIEAPGPKRDAAGDASSQAAMAPAGDRTGQAQDPGALRVATDQETGAYPQGVEGQVVSSAGGTLAAEVFLLYGVAPQDMIQALAAMASAGGRPRARIAASTKTDGMGRFRLDSPVTDSAANFELRIRADRHVVHTQSIRITPNRWEKLPIITLDRGKTMQGVVRDRDSKAVIADATVAAKLPNMNFLVPTPGLEDGVTTTTDSGGRYTLEGLPAMPLELSAFAKGYGTAVKPNIVIADTETVHVEDIELPRGYEIEGLVMDGEGNPILGARVEAIALSQENATTGYAMSQKDGAFTILGLAEGTYTVVAKASGYVKRDKPGVLAGEKDLQLVLEQQGTVRARVRAKNGRPVSSYHLELRRHFAGNDQYGKSEVDPVDVRGASNGEYVMRGVDPGSYVLQVESIQFAKTYSAPFTVADAQTQEVVVDVVMNEGGTIFGTVTDESGRPVAGVSVFTLDDSFQDNPLTQMFRGLMPVKVTERSVVTNDRGEFRIEKLTPAKYQLRIDHPDYTRTYRKGFDVADGQKCDTGPVRLAGGGRVDGTVFVNGIPAPACKVTISSTGDDNTAPVFETVFTNEKGRFEIPRLLPPGRYEVNATRTDHANPFLQLADIQKSRKEVVVRQGNQSVTIQIAN